MTGGRDGGGRRRVEDMAHLDMDLWEQGGEKTHLDGGQRHFPTYK